MTSGMRKFTNGLNSASVAAFSAKRVGVTSIQSVTWEAVSNGAELTNNPASNGGGVRIFPEKATYNGDVLNKVNVRVALSKAIPTGMSGTVYLDVLDPMNQCTAYGGVDENGDEISLLVGNPYVYSNTPAGTETLPVTVSPGTDNHGNGTLNPVMSLSFQADSASQNAEFTISQANAGDNFIAVALPDVAAIAAVRIGTETESSVLKYNVPVLPGSSVQEFSTSHHTPLLTVWRSLWVEKQQMYIALGGVSRTGDMPLLDGFVSEEMARSCVEIKEMIPENHTFSGSLIFETGGSAGNDTLDGIDLSNVATIAENRHTFGVGPDDNSYWTLFIIGCLGSNSPLGAHYTFANMILIFKDNIRSFTDTAIENGNSVSTDDFKRLITLHEIVHAFNYRGGTLDDGRHDSNNLMGKYVNPNCSTNVIDYSLSPIHIRAIQSSDRAF